GDDGEQARDPVGGRKAEGDLGQPEVRPIGRDTQVLGDREHEPAAQRVAVDGGDRHLRQAREALHDRRVPPREGFGLVGRDRLHFLDVVAGAGGTAPAGAVAARGQKSVLKNGRTKNGDRPALGGILPSRSPSTRSIVSAINTSEAALANAGSASAGCPT